MTSPVSPDAAPALARRFADFAQGLRLERVPAEVSLRARHLMLDAIGCAMASRGEVYASRFADAVRDVSGPAAAAAGEAAVIGFADRLPMRDAALLNGMLMHGLDYDDTHMAGIVHLTVSVLPTLLAVAARRGSSGAAVVAAYIAAIEAGTRIASVARGGFHHQGFHPTGVVGAFASALAAGRLLGLDADGLARAQGIALSMASGSLQFLEDGAWTKRVHPGWAAQAGITAATFAAHDIPAPLAAYEGRFGLFNLYLGAQRDGVDPARGADGLDAGGGASPWELMNVAVKPFAVCHFSHAAADAAIAVHRTGIDARRIESVEVLMPAGTMPVVCDPIEAKRRPQSDYEAKFSVPYAVASGLLRGRLGLRELLPAAFTDADALALMDRIRCVADPASTFPQHYTGEIVVTLDDGRQIRHREGINRGHAERPLRNEDVRDKFLANATLHFSEPHALAVCESVLALDRADSIATLDGLLGREP
jgi:2-methylcitrate dehydratase PrpD